MKSEWRVASNYIDRRIYQVYRLIDVDKIQHSGNMEIYMCYDSKSEAEAEAARLNEEGGNHED